MHRSRGTYANTSAHRWPSVAAAAGPVSRTNPRLAALRDRGRKRERHQQHEYPLPSAMTYVVVEHNDMSRSVNSADPSAATP